MAKLRFKRNIKQDIEDEKIIDYEPIEKLSQDPDEKKEDIGSIIDEKINNSNTEIKKQESDIKDTKKSESLYDSYKKSHTEDEDKKKDEKTLLKQDKQDKALPDKKTKKPKKEDMAKFVVKEAKQGINWGRAGLYLCAFGMVGIIFFSQMAKDINPVFVILIWLFGMMCFLPLGFIGGWLFLDPYMRCKLYRRFRGKNYGIVNFLHIGGQRIVTRIKDLDNDVIIEGGRMWLLDSEGIYYIDKNNEKKLWKKIDTEHIKTLPANVPCLFLDPETMTPIKFIEKPSKTNPQQAGAVILGYINNQIQKNAMFKRTATIFYIIIIAVTVVNLIIAVQTYTWIEEIHKLMPGIRQQLSHLGDLLAQYNPPVP